MKWTTGHLISNKTSVSTHPNQLNLSHKLRVARVTKAKKKKGISNKSITKPSMSSTVRIQTNMDWACSKKRWMMTWYRTTTSATAASMISRKRSMTIQATTNITFRLEMHKSRRLQITTATRILNMKSHQSLIPSTLSYASQSQTYSPHPNCQLITSFPRGRAWVRAKTAPLMAKTRQNTTSNLQQIHLAKFTIPQPITTPKISRSSISKTSIHSISWKAIRASSTASWMSLTELYSPLRGRPTSENISTNESIYRLINHFYLKLNKY